MENPHAERQAILLERILKNTVWLFFGVLSSVHICLVKMYGDDS